MKPFTNKVYLLCFLFTAFQIELFSQNENIVGAYVGMEREIIIIEDNNFKIVANMLNNRIDKNDSIIAFGNIKYLNNEFIEINTVNYRYNVLKSMVFSEFQSSKTIDSTAIKFIFPFSGKYKIVLYIKHKKYESINNSEITLPIKIKKGESIYFKIFDLDIYPEMSGNYFGIVAFCSLDYKVKKDNTDSISISIPELTNTFFQRYVIKGEYIRIKDGALRWRGNYYEKIWKN